LTIHLPESVNLKSDALIIGQRFTQKIIEIEGARQEHRARRRNALPAITGLPGGAVPAISAMRPEGRSRRSLARAIPRRDDPFSASIACHLGAKKPPAGEDSPLVFGATSIG